MKSVNQVLRNSWRRLAACGVLLAVLGMAGCGSRTRNDVFLGYDAENNYDSASDDILYEKESDFAYDSIETSVAESTNQYSSVSNSTRKLIKNVQMRVETVEFDTFWQALENQIAECGGYVESSELYNSSRRVNRQASLSIRVPAEKLENFCTGVSETSHVISKSETGRDVTLAYYDLESHVTALRVEYETLIDILEKCTEVADVIDVQSRITEVLYQIESYQTQLNNYDNLVAYSTVSLSVYEVETETVLEKQTMGERIAEGFSETMQQLVEDAQDITVSLITHLPYLLLWAVVILVIVLAIRGMWKRHKRKKAARTASPVVPKS